MSHTFAHPVVIPFQDEDQQDMHIVRKESLCARVYVCFDDAPIQDGAQRHMHMALQESLRISGTLNLRIDKELYCRTERSGS